MKKFFVWKIKFEDVHCSNQYFIFFFEQAKFDAISFILQSKDWFIFIFIFHKKIFFTCFFTCHFQLFTFFSFFLTWPPLREYVLYIMDCELLHFIYHIFKSYIYPCSIKYIFVLPHRFFYIYFLSAHMSARCSEFLYL